MIFEFKNDKTLGKEDKEFVVKECNEFLQLMRDVKQLAVKTERFIEQVENDRKEQAQNLGKKKYACGSCGLDVETKTSTHYYYTVWFTDKELKTRDYEIPTNGITRTYKYGS